MGGEGGDVRATEFELQQRVQSSLYVTNLLSWTLLRELTMLVVVMEYCEGGDVKNRTPADGIDDADLVWEWVRDAARAIKACHAHRIMHMDVKPENLLLRRRGAVGSQDGGETGDRNYDVQLADFGLSFECAPPSEGDLVVVPHGTGSKAYMSPELLALTEPTEQPFGACDMWALGISAFQMAFGSLPDTQKVANDLDGVLNNIKPHQRSTHGKMFEELLRRTLNSDPRKRNSAETLVAWMETREEDAGERLSNTISVTPSRSALFSQQSSTMSDASRSTNSNLVSTEASMMSVQDMSVQSMELDIDRQLRAIAPGQGPS